MLGFICKCFSKSWICMLCYCVNAVLQMCHKLPTKTDQLTSGAVTNGTLTCIATIACIFVISVIVGVNFHESTWSLLMLPSSLSL